jgi:hypothetical protein
MGEAMRKDHEIHRRRRSRNFGVLAILLAFVALLFWVKKGDPAGRGRFGHGRHGLGGGAAV